MSSSFTEIPLTIHILSFDPVKWVTISATSTSGKRHTHKIKMYGDIYVLRVNDSALLMHSQILPRSDGKAYDREVKHVFYDVGSIMDAYKYTSITFGENGFTTEDTSLFGLCFQPENLFSRADNLSKVPTVIIRIDGTCLKAIYIANKRLVVQKLCDVLPTCGVTITTTFKSFALVGPQLDAYGSPDLCQTHLRQCGFKVEDLLHIRVGFYRTFNATPLIPSVKPPPPELHPSIAWFTPFAQSTYTPPVPLVFHASLNTTSPLPAPPAPPTLHPSIACLLNLGQSRASPASPATPTNSKTM